MRILSTTLLIGCGISLCASTQAQRQQIWAFGYEAGLDFSGASPTPISTGIKSEEAGATVCNESGELLFYTDGSYIWDKNHHLMANGRDITGEGDRDFGNTSATGGICQGALIVPMPDSAHKYYVFSLAGEQFLDTVFAPGKLYYTVVNMDRIVPVSDTTYNVDPFTHDTVSMDINSYTSYGDVEPGQSGILLDSNLAQALSGVAGAACNVWIMTQSWASTQFRAFEIASEGINMTPVLSGDATPDTSMKYALQGQIAFSPDRSKLAVTRAALFHPSFSRVSTLELYDFDIITGKVSNQILLDSTSQSFLPYYGVCFSPDNSKLYYNFFSAIYQFDITPGSNTEIVASKTFVANIGYLISSLQRGPDGKIYFPNDQFTLGVINFPNLAGTACGINQVAVEFTSGELVNGLSNVIPEVIYDTPSVTGITVTNTGNSYRFKADGFNAITPSLVTYEWQFGDGTTAQTDTAKHHYPAAGTYTVTLIVSNCTGSDTVTTQISVATGVEAVGNGSETVQIYPIPASQSIHLSALKNPDINHIRIVNSIGAKVYEYTGRWDLSGSIDISYLPAGYYVLNAGSNSGQYHLPFIVVK